MFLWCTMEYNNAKGGSSVPLFTPKKPEKDVISIRISLELLKEVDNVAYKTKISRNELLNQCIKYAIENFYIKETNGNKNELHL